MPATTSEPVDLDAIAASIAQRHPDVPVETIEAEVSEAAHGFSGATVLDFLPVLIERAVRQRLRVLAVA